MPNRVHSLVVLLTVVSALVTVGATGCSSGITVVPDLADGAVTEGWDVGDAAGPGGCTTDDDCIPILNYRNGFECYMPCPASKADVARDPCLVPWKPNPGCTTASPPTDCPSGEIPVTHSCFVIECVAMACKGGRCSLSLPSTCPNQDAGVPDCEALRIAYVNALASAQQCDPSRTQDSCAGFLADTCGCTATYDLDGPYANAAFCAFSDWQNAMCHNVDCGKTCPDYSGGATCVPNQTGTMGTCVWQ